MFPICVHLRSSAAILFLVSALPFGSIGAADLSRAPATDLLARYQQLRTVALDPERVAVVENFAIEKDPAAVLKFKSGNLYFFQPVNNQVTGAVFIGEGTLAVNPPTPVERRHLMRFTGGSLELQEPFKEAVFLFTDASAARVFSELKPKPQPVSNTAAGVLNDFRKVFRDDLKSNIAARVLSDMTNASQAMFLADIKGEKHGRLMLSFDPLSREEIELVNYNSAMLYVDTVSAFRPGGAALADKSIVDTTRVKLDTTLDGKRLSGEARIEFTPLVDGPRVLAMRLVRSLRVSKAATLDGKELSFIQEDKKKDGELWVILPAPLKKGEATGLVLSYAGDDVVTSAGSGNFFVGARTSWYPSVRNSGDSFLDRAIYEMTFRAPKQFQVVATGRLVKQHEEGKQSITEWSTDIPYTVVGFNYGKYKSKSAQEGEHQITVYANTSLGDELQSIRNLLEQNQDLARDLGITPGGFNTTGMMDAALAEARNSVRLFEQFFGPMPYKTLSITQQPAGYFGQSWPTLVFMPYTAFLDSTIRHQLGMGEGSTKRFLDEVSSHEVAHQWWGHIVGWQDYHDQWLSEGFAQFSAGLYTHWALGTKKFRSFLENERQEILVTLPGRPRPANDAGPIWLGERIDTRKNEGAYRLIYSKGGYVLHMLRMMLYNFAQNDDTRFIAMMRDFVRTWRDKNAGTEDFKRICDKHFKEDMGWFFNQWVYGTDVPNINVQYTVVQGPASPVLKVDVALDRVPQDFKLKLPVLARFGQGGASALLPVQGKGHFELKLPQVPDSVEFNPLHAVLCNLEVKKF